MSSETQPVGTGADDSSVGTKTWSNPSNITTTTSQSFITSTSSGVFSHYLKATNFNFSIPTDATIDGIEIVVHTQIDPLPNIAPDDYVAKLVIGGSVVGNNLASGTQLSNGQTSITYGGATELWGTSPTYSDINNSNFGFVFQIELNGGGKFQPSSMYVGNSGNYGVEVTVYYTEGATSRRIFIIS